LPLERWWREWRLPASFLLAAFLAQVGSSYADYRSLDADNERLRLQMDTTYRDVVPQGAISDPEKQLKRKLSGQKSGSNSAGFVVLMEQIGRVVGAQEGALIASVNFTEKVGDVRLNLYAPDFKAVESIRAGLAAKGMEADLENSNAQGEGVRARLKVREK
jgi:general secretion pathway protein L